MNFLGLILDTIDATDDGIDLQVEGRTFKQNVSYMAMASMVRFLTKCHKANLNYNNVRPERTAVHVLRDSGVRVSWRFENREVTAATTGNGTMLSLQCNETDKDLFHNPRQQFYMNVPSMRVATEWLITGKTNFVGSRDYERCLAIVKDNNAF